MTLKITDLLSFLAHQAWYPVSLLSVPHSSIVIEELYPEKQHSPAPENTRQKGSFNFLSLRLKELMYTSSWCSDGLTLKRLCASLQQPLPQDLPDWYPISVCQKGPPYQESSYLDLGITGLPGRGYNTHRLPTITCTPSPFSPFGLF